MAFMNSPRLKERNNTRPVRVGGVTLGAHNPIAVQSMTATKTQDVEATAAQIRLLQDAGADIVRIAVDSDKDAHALAEIRARTSVALSVDLQESYRLAPLVAPHVGKLRYNPGHLHHHEKQLPIRDKVAFIAEAAEKNGCAIRIGVNCGSVDPRKKGQFGDDDVAEMVDSAVEHCELLDDLGFHNFVVSLKDSDPNKVIDANIRFASSRPDVALHLGVTEAGLPPDGVIKTRIAFEQIISRGIGDTIRVSLTVPNDKKGLEIEVGRQILDDIRAGRFRSVPRFEREGLNIIACPSCSRVENESFVGLAEQVRDMTVYAKKHDITIAVMGCRVNGPGETDDADLGLWCGPKTVNLKRGEETVGSYPYSEVLGVLRSELDTLIRSRQITVQ
jgi:(E)-4-hydroxy-3-methylbut-2-enyl-diphosphate synthase